MIADAILIESLRDDDIPALSKLAADIWWHHYPTMISDEQIHYMLELMYSHDSLQQQLTDGHHFLSAKQGSAMIGYLSCEALGEGNYFIHKFYVHPKAQSKGIGKQLFQQILIDFSDCQQIELCTNRENHNAIAFYERQGFSINRKQDRDIGCGFVMNDYVMRWTAR